MKNISISIYIYISDNSKKKSKYDISANLPLSVEIMEAIEL